MTPKGRLGGCRALNAWHGVSAPQTAVDMSNLLVISGNACRLSESQLRRIRSDEETEISVLVKAVVTSIGRQAPMLK